nr:hypothetical protein [Tanacetum cinerariifolium]
MQMVGDNGGNQNQVAQNAIQNLRIQNIRNQNGQIIVPGTNQNPNGNGNLVAARAKGNATWHNAKFVGYFQSLAKEADESLAKHKALELEIERLLRAVVSQDIMSVVQNNSVGETSILQTELEPYNDMQQKIERLQAQLGDLKGKSKDISCVSDTFNPLFQKHENENLELEFQIPTPQESKVVKNDKVIAPGMSRINPFKPSREEKHVPNKVRASVRTKPITVSQPPVFAKKVMNSDSNGLSSTGVDNTKTKRLQPRSNTKNDRMKENQEKDKIRSKPDKNGKRGEAKKSLKQLQW